MSQCPSSYGMHLVSSCDESELDCLQELLPSSALMIPTHHFQEQTLVKSSRGEAPCPVPAATCWRPQLTGWPLRQGFPVG